MGKPSSESTYRSKAYALCALLFNSPSLEDAVTGVLSMTNGEMCLYLNGQFQKWPSMIDSDLLANSYELREGQVDGS